MKPTFKHLSEVEIVQNEALGAYALWRFVRGYISVSDKLPYMHLAFIVLPIVMHQDTLMIALSTRPSSSLSLFAAKLHRRPDIIVGIHTRMLRFRTLSWRSLCLSTSRGIVQVSAGTGEIYLPYTEVSISAAGGGRSTTAIGRASERLGYWCGRQSLRDIAFALQVQF